MNYHQRRAFLREIEQQATKDPTAYEQRVLRAIASARRLLRGSLLAAATLTVVAVVAGSLDWVPDWLAWLVFLVAGFAAALIWNASRVTLGEPGGYRISREMFPLLFKDLRELRTKLKAPRFDEVLFTDQLNASIVEIPQALGLLPPRRVLSIGFQLLYSLDREEFNAVLAHEIGHVSKQHNRTSRSGYRLLLEIHQLRASLESRLASGSWNPLMPVLAAYLERLELLLLRLKRVHELEADRLAAAATSTELSARTLCKIHALGEYWDDALSEDIAARMVQSDIPNLQLLAFYRSKITKPELEAVFRRSVERCFHSRALPGSTHPALGERLAALKVTEIPVLTWKVGESAAVSYFGRDAEKVAAEMDRDWLRWVVPLWKERHLRLRQAAGQRAKILGLEKSGQKLGLGDLWSLAACEQRCVQYRSASATLERILQRFPAADEAKLALARLLLKSDARRGEQLLLEIAESHPLLRFEAAETLIALFSEEGRREELAKVEKLLAAHEANAEAVFEERTEFKRSDEFLAVKLSREETEAIYRIAGELGTVEKLWLLERKVVHHPQVKSFVVVYRPTSKAQAGSLVADTTAVLTTEIYLPGTTVVVAAYREHAYLARRADRVAGEPVFSNDD